MTGREVQDAVGLPYITLQGTLEQTLVCSKKRYDGYTPPPETLHNQPETLHPKPYTRNNPPSTIIPKPVTPQPEP